MLQTLFVIPYEVGGVRLFGFGVLLAVWAAISAVVVFRAVRREGFSAEVRGYLPLILIVGAAIWLLPVVMPGGMPIRGYGVMMLLGVVSGVALAWHRARQVGFNPDLILTLAFWLFISGIVGARAFYVIEYWSEFRAEHPEWRDFLGAVFNVSQGGLVVYGSFIAAMAAVVVFVRRYRVLGLALADLIVPSMFLGLALGRVGCLLNGCCFGGSCEQPWAVTFPWGSPPHARQAELTAEQGGVDLHGIWLRGEGSDRPVIEAIEPGSAAETAGLRAGDELLVVGGLIRDYAENGVLTDVPVRHEVASAGKARAALLQVRGKGASIRIEAARPNPQGSASIISASWTLGESPRSRPVHPTQVYAAINAALICLVLLAYAPFHRRDGEVIGLALLIYPIARFLEERIRIDESAVLNTEMSISENISILVFAAAVVLWIYILNRPAKLAFRRSGLSPDGDGS